MKFVLEESIELPSSVTTWATGPVIKRISRLVIMDFFVVAIRIVVSEFCEVFKLCL